MILIGRLLEKEEEYKQDLEAHLALKEAHTQAVMREKEEAIEEVCEGHLYYQ